VAAGSPAELSGGAIRPDDQETFSFGRLSEPIVERDESKGCGLILRGDDCRRKLQRIGGTQRMDAQEPNGDLPNAPARLDFCPCQGQRIQAIKGADRRSSVKGAIALAAGHG
jgi:hypothetical protein